MKDKYYTPEIEEFHVGFEYEYNGKCIFTNDMSIAFMNYLITNNNKQIRVKHLDQEDIESFDWEFKLNGYSEDGVTTFSKFQKGDKFLLLEDNLYTTIWMENLNSVVYFRGTIKNKSELKRILKQIGI